MGDKNYILDILKNSGTVTEEQLKEATNVAKSKSSTVLKALKELGYVNGSTVAQALASTFAMDWVSLAEADISRETLNRVPPDVARR